MILTLLLNFLYFGSTYMSTPDHHMEYTCTQARYMQTYGLAIDYGEWGGGGSATKREGGRAGEVLHLQKWGRGGKSFGIVLTQVLEVSTILEG